MVYSIFGHLLKFLPSKQKKSVPTTINVKKTTLYTHVNGDRRSQFAHRKQQK